MYQKPDFVKISLKVKDVFANYTITGCVPETFDSKGYLDSSLATCNDIVTNTYISIGWGSDCYKTQNP